ncbi:hypothetical protein [Haladaptatus caseinilyticus]|uniref:hypothetical protein n=1 Tax=Haladaptatus caseinilyticus TaxID=2993314 RepID=UPI00224B7F86|nr:hypothetical protein [Haladaptatus caseinilyticus]
MDGKEHELPIVDPDGEKAVKNDDAEEKAKKVTLTFTISKAMTEYYYEYHFQSIRGSVTTGESQEKDCRVDI